MTESTVAIIGSGIAGASVAWQLTQMGHQVVVFEKGPEYPYPYRSQFRERVLYRYRNPAHRLPADLKSLTASGTYRHDINREREMWVGGSSTQWNAITLRMIPEDFHTRTSFGYGRDWPVTYAELEPYYCRGEAMLGVAGTDEDNHFAPYRSMPYPLPPFELGARDSIFAEQLRAHDIALHTTPQARTRRGYDERPACPNFGTCMVACPVGALYSPAHHLNRAVQTGRCQVLSNVSVRRIVMDGHGRARSLVYQKNHEDAEEEVAAEVVVVAAGAIESPRLLLLSADDRHPEGLGNEGGHVGRHLAFHHLWNGSIVYREPVLAGRIGPVTGQSHQFLSPPHRGPHGGVKVEFSANHLGRRENLRSATTASDALERLQRRSRRRGIFLHAESVPTPQKYVSLSRERDRFGDRFAHVHYESSDFDRETHAFSQRIYDRFAEATGGEKEYLAGVDDFISGAHHMGTCRMGTDASDSVVDSFARVHDTVNLFVVGSSSFVGTSGAMNPTLTLVALAIRTADYIASRLL
jgi:choline dehydrogenase-like flavoprotein